MNPPSTTMRRRKAWGPLTALGFASLASACATPGASPSGSEPVATDLACTLPSNCVNSMSANGPAPLRFEGSAEQAMAALKATLAGFPEAKTVSTDVTTLSAIFTTSVGFQDRVDFIVDAPRQRIDYRSKSQLGLYDFGKNRSRMADFAERFEQTRRR